jgi:hypothetical protein
VSLCTPDVDQASRPLDVFQAELASFASTQSQPGQEQNESSFPAAPSPGRLAGGEHVLEFFRREVMRQGDRVPATHAGHSLDQRLGDQTLGNQKTEEGTHRRDYRTLPTTRVLNFGFHKMTHARSSEA